MDQLIKYSGDNYRELLKLLHYCFQFTDGEQYILQATELAEKALTGDCRRILFNLAFLEYNSFWWKSHPVIRTLPAHQSCLKTKSPPFTLIQKYRKGR